MTAERDVAYIRYRRAKADVTRRRKDADKAQREADRLRFIERRAVYAASEAWITWQAMAPPLTD